MKKLLVVFVFLFVTASFAQISYLQYRYVPAEHEEKFIERETKHWSKVAKAAIAKGQMTSWSLWRQVGVLNSDDSWPNYVFVNSYAKLNQLDTQSIWAGSIDALGDVKPKDIETGSFTTTTFDYYMQREDFIDGEYKYAVVNYAKPVDLGAFIEENKTLWKPLHASNIKNGNGLTAWSISSVVYPGGNQDRFSVFTVDGFNKLSDAMDYLRYTSPDPSANAADNPWTAVLSKTKMSEILPNGFQYRLIYERIMTVE